MISFSATQSIDLAIQRQPIPIQHYLRQPKRLVHALADPKRVEVLSPTVFRLRMRPLAFMTLHIQPTVDLAVNVDAQGRVELEAIACEIRGNAYINQRFSLALSGRLSPQLINHNTHLIGRADLTVSVDLPPILEFTPKPLLEATGNGVLLSVLLTIKQRLGKQLLLDYESWVRQYDFEQRNGADVSKAAAARLHPSQNL
ncbi:MAG: DUF1997 domain-containing protein [Cyanobacteria bacterium P01_H01_bin.119]